MHYRTNLTCAALCRLPFVRITHYLESSWKHQASNHSHSMEMHAWNLRWGKTVVTVWTCHFSLSVCVCTVRWVLCNAETSPRFLPSSFRKLSESHACLCGSLGSSPPCKVWSSHTVNKLQLTWDVFMTTTTRQKSPKSGKPKHHLLGHNWPLTRR